MKKLIPVLMFFISISYLTAEENILSVTRAILCTSIESREPKGETSSFIPGDRAYFFTEISNGTNGNFIYHVWSFNDGEKTYHISKIKLPVNTSRWRTWSYNTVSKEGTWNVKVLDSAENILQEKSFRVSRTTTEEISDTPKTDSETEKNTVQNNFSDDENVMIIPE